jgi:putative transposase
MADEMRIGLDELLRKARGEGDAGFLREGVRALSQALMEMEVEQHVGAARHERTPERSGYRNGYRNGYRGGGTGTRGSGPWSSRFPGSQGRGSYFPSLLEPRRRAERALAAVVQEAGVRPRALHPQGRRARQGAGHDGHLQKPGLRALRGARRGGCALAQPAARRSLPLRVARRHLPEGPPGRARGLGGGGVIAIGGNGRTGEREVLGLGGGSQRGRRSFWASFLRSLVARGLSRAPSRPCCRELPGSVAGCTS